jgi:dTDP-4-amino-4,6-dideoxygalactose transaminase
VPSGKKDKVRELEKEFSKKFGVKYSLAVNSGTSALISALIACSIGPVMKLLYRVILFLLHVHQFLLQRQYL